MALLPLTYAPHPIYKQTSAPVEAVDETIKSLVADLFDTLEYEQAVGMAAPMVGLLTQVAVVDLRPNDTPEPYCFINPTITWRSDEQQSNEEASICFPGISATVTRPHAIKLDYLNLQGEPQTLKAEGFLACVIQHEVDYLHGRVFLDYLSKMKRDMLMKKMQKHLKAHPPHVHSASCNH